MPKLAAAEALAQAFLAEAEGYESLGRAARLRAAAAEADSESDAEPIDVKQTLVEFGVGRACLKSASARGELTLLKGARRRLLITRSELRRWLASRPDKGPGPTKAQAAAADYDALDAELQRGGLVRGAR